MKIVTTKLTAESLRALRILAAVTGELQYVAMERILRAELAKVKTEAHSVAPAPRGTGTSLREP